jgi:hypothetical protein
MSHRAGSFEPHSTGFPAKVRQRLGPKQISSFVQSLEWQRLCNLSTYRVKHKHHTVGDPAAATTDLGDKTKLAFTVDAPPDGAGPTQVLTRTPGKEIFLIVRYSM